MAAPVFLVEMKMTPFCLQRILVVAPVFLVEMKEADDFLLLITNACGCFPFLVEMKGHGGNHEATLGTNGHPWCPPTY